MIESIAVPLRHWRHNDRAYMLPCVAIVCDSCRSAGPYSVPSKDPPRYQSILTQAIDEGWKITIDPPQAECPGCQSAAVAGALPDSVVIDLRGLS